MVGDKLLSDLRKAKNVVTPAEVLEIRDFWFVNIDVESATILANSKEFGPFAFYGCQ